MLAEVLLRRVAALAPGIRLDFDSIPEDMHESEHGLRNCDALIGPLGFGFPGSQEPLFRDRFVCVVDPANRALRDGRLTLDDLAALPHAARYYGPTHVTPTDRVMDELSVRRRVQVVTVGFLPLPFLVAGTDLVTIIPERLARAGGGAARADGGGAAVRPGRADRDPLVAPGPGHHPRARLAAADADRGGGVAAAGGERVGRGPPGASARPAGLAGPAASVWAGPPPPPPLGGRSASRRR